MPTYSIPDGGCGCCAAPACDNPDNDWTGVYPAMPSVWVVDPLAGLASVTTLGGTAYGDCHDVVNDCCAYLAGAGSLDARTLVYDSTTCCWFSLEGNLNCSESANCDGVGAVPPGVHSFGPPVNEPGPSLCYDAGADTWTLTIPSMESELQPTSPFAPIAATYTLAGGSFDPTGPNDFALSAAGGGCSNWPDPLTIRPA